MTIRYLSLFSGIEAASVAWRPLGWHCVGVAEIEPFANAALAHHYPDVLNLGSVVDLRDRLLAGDDVAGLLSNPPDLIVGGSPCQAWSVAGSRKGLSDPRGQLTLVYAEIIHAIRPEFIVWENVPGVLSAKDNGFGHLLGSLTGHGEPIPVPPGHKRWSNAGVVAGPLQETSSWTLAWRILDAQHFGVPQRRRRVFLVGCSATSGRDPSEILFERQSMPGNSAPRGKARKDIAPTLASRATGGGLRPAGLRPAGGLGTDFDLDGGLIPKAYALQEGVTRENPDSGPDGVGVQKDIAYTLEARSEVQMVAVNTQTAFGGNNTGGSIRIATAVNACASASGRMDFESETFVVEPVYCEPAANGSMAPVAFDCKAGGNTSFSIGDKPGTMRGEGHGGGHLAVAFQPGNLRRGCGANPSLYTFPTLKADHGRGLSDQFPHIAHTLRAEGFDASEDSTGRGIPLVPVLASGKSCWVVRRLPPIECARLQGFPDHHLDITYRSKPAADGNKYKALGNSMAVPVMRWIGERISQ